MVASKPIASVPVAASAVGTTFPAVTTTTNSGAISRYGIAGCPIAAAPPAVSAGTTTSSGAIARWAIAGTPVAGYPVQGTAPTPPPTPTTSTSGAIAKWAVAGCTIAGWPVQGTAPPVPPGPTVYYQHDGKGGKQDNRRRKRRQRHDLYQTLDATMRALVALPPERRPSVVAVQTHTLDLTQGLAHALDHFLATAAAHESLAGRLATLRADLLRLDADIRDRAFDAEDEEVMLFL